MNALVLIVPAVVAIVAIAVLRASPLAGRLVDRPNERSLHESATPRLGGIGVMLGAMPVLLICATPEMRWIAGAAIGLAFLSLGDDAWTLPVAVRLPCHFAAAALVVTVIPPSAGPVDATSVAIAAAVVLAIAWMTNLFNFMDGADGLAGGMAAIGFAAFGIAAWRVGDQAMACGSFALGAASAGFLAFNFPPARVFMGDAGSVPLGFLAGALGWLGTAGGLWPGWFPVLVFSPFIVDATVTLAKRAAKGEPVLRAHRSHYYQRLILGGWSHRRLATWSWALMASAAASAVAALVMPAAVQNAMILFWAIAYGVLIGRMERDGPREPS